MSGVRGKVGSFELEWVTVPRGREGMSQVRVAGGAPIDVRWRMDDDGIWIELPEGARGYDLAGEPGDDGTLTFRVSERQGSGEWSGLAFRRAGEDQAAASAGAQRKGLRVRAQMPGKIVRVLVKAGQAIERDQPLLVMEAMKMENEIRAPGPGTVKTVPVVEGQAVESGADLVLVE